MPSLKMFSRDRCTANGMFLTQQTSASGKQIKATCESNWWAHDKYKQAFRQGMTGYGPGSVTRDSGRQEGCWKGHDVEI